MNKKNEQALDEAVLDEDWETIEKLIAEFPDLSQTSAGEEVVALAAEDGKLDILKRLLKSGADVTATPGGKPLIFSAIHSRSEQVVSLLIDFGVDLDCSWGVWESPLANCLAADEGGMSEIVNLLAEKSGVSSVDKKRLAASVGSRTKTTFEKKLGESSLKEVETTLNVKIPSFYRAFLAVFPDDLVTENDEGIYHSTDLIIKSTKASREYKEAHWAAPFPDNMIAVGWNGGGSVFCIRSGRKKKEIYLFDHELGAIDPSETLNLDEFVEMAMAAADEA